MKKIILLIILLVNINFAMNSTTIIQMTLSDSKEGLLNGNHVVDISLLDSVLPNPLQFDENSLF